MVSLFYTTYISVDLAHHEIFRAKVGKGGIKRHNKHETEKNINDPQKKYPLGTVSKNILLKGLNMPPFSL